MSIGDDYENAVRAGNKPLANYLAQMLASNAGININSNSVEAAPVSLLPNRDSSSTSSPSQKGFWEGLLDFPLLPSLGNASPNSISGSVSSAAKTVSDVVGGTSAALKFITDIPRVTTTLLGLILIIAGIFALASGSAAKTVVNVVKNNVTS